MTRFIGLFLAIGCWGVMGWCHAEAKDHPIAKSLTKKETPLQASSVRACAGEDLPGNWELIRFDSSYRFKKPAGSLFIPSSGVSVFGSGRRQIGPLALSHCGPSGQSVRGGTIGNELSRRAERSYRSQGEGARGACRNVDLPSRDARPWDGERRKCHARWRPDHDVTRGRWAAVVCAPPPKERCLAARCIGISGVLQAANRWKNGEECPMHSHVFRRGCHGRSESSLESAAGR